MKIRKVLSYILADEENFTLENRLLISVILVGILASLLGSIVSLLISSSLTVLLIALSLFLFQIVLYYFIRIKRKFNTFIVPIIIVSFIGISLIWILDGGINGSNLFLAFVILILALVIVSDKNKKYVFLLFIAHIITIYLIQFFKPDLIINFSSETTRWVDSLITAIYSSFFIFVIIKFLHKNYTLEKNRAEENEEKYKTIVNLIGEGLGITDYKENVIYANQPAEQIFEVEPGTLVGRNLKEFLTHDQTKIINKQTENRKNGKSTTYEAVLTCNNKKSKDILLTATPSYNKEGKTTGSLAVFRDITKRKKAELKIQQNEARLNAILNTTLIGITVANKNGNFLYINPASEKHVGLSKEEIFGMHFKDFVHPDDLKIVLKTQDEMLANKIQFADHEIRIIHKPSGKYFWAHINMSKLNKAFEIAEETFLVTHQDITRMKENEQSLKNVNATKDKFFNIIAHDLRSPFSSILGLSKFLLEHHAEYDAKQREQLIKPIVNSGQKTLELLENLLEWAKTQTGQLTLNPDYFELQLLIYETFNISEEAAKNKGISLSSDITESFSVYVDKEIIKTVLRNLISNALKFTPKGGSIKVNAVQDNEKITLSVIDTGVGMSKEKQNSLFDLSQKESTNGTEGEAGSGLGLMLCKEFVEKQGGTIWIDSKEEIGTTFYFTIPKKNY